MILPDVNVLLYAYREDAVDHKSYRRWLEDAINDDGAFGISQLVLSGFLRIVTHSRVFQPPSPIKSALEFVQQILEQPNCVVIQPGERHWSIFIELCTRVAAKGNLIPDAYLAALAIESGCTWVTTDRDYSRFPRLKWKHPLEVS